MFSSHCCVVYTIKRRGRSKTWYTVGCIRADPSSSYNDANMPMVPHNTKPRRVPGTDLRGDLHAGVVRHKQIGERHALHHLDACMALCQKSTHIRWAHVFVCMCISACLCLSTSGTGLFGRLLYFWFSLQNNPLTKALQFSGWSAGIVGCWALYFAFPLCFSVEMSWSHTSRQTKKETAVRCTMSVFSTDSRGCLNT